jgi:uncharacterized repeat protein (TIGR03803 family)
MRHRFVLLYRRDRCAPPFEGNDGGFPFDGLIREATGNFYGTTAGGGTESDGTVFELTAGQK